MQRFLQTPGSRRRSRSAAIAVALSVAAPLALAGGASAATYTPLTGPQLQADIVSANANPGPDTIVLADTAYNTTATMTITEDLRITGDHANQAPLGGPRIVASAVLPTQSAIVVVDAGVTATFEGFTLRDSASTDKSVHVLGTLRADNVAIAGNAGSQVQIENGAAATITNSSINNGLRAGVRLIGTSTVTLRNSTVAYQDEGGVLFPTTATVHLRNTIVADNDLADIATPDCSRAVTSQIASLDSDGRCGVSITANPMLGASALNGGPTPTLVPGAGSPAINAGNNAACQTTDQRFFVRSDGQCDIGAYEVGGVRDVTPPTCFVTAIRAGPPKQQDVTTQDTGSGLGPNAITGLFITNGAVAYAAFPTPSTGPLVLTATKDNQNDTTFWSYTATDWAGNSKFCI